MLFLRFTWSGNGVVENGWSINKRGQCLAKVEENVIHPLLLTKAWYVWKKGKFSIPEGEILLCDGSAMLSVPENHPDIKKLNDFFS